jgi:hypothetical protein
VNLTRGPADGTRIDRLMTRRPTDHDLLGAIGSGQLRFAEVTRYTEERSVCKAGTPMAMRVKTAGGA